MRLLYIVSVFCNTSKSTSRMRPSSDKIEMSGLSELLHQGDPSNIFVSATDVV